MTVDLPYALFVQEGQPVRTTGLVGESNEHETVEATYEIMADYAKAGFLVRDVYGNTRTYYVWDSSRGFFAVRRLSYGLLLWNDMTEDMWDKPLLSCIKVDPSNLAHQVLLVDAVPYVKAEVFEKVTS